ncbi:AAA family ATPase [Shewanella sp. 10N.261.52.F9]|uniref:ATP-binding protein n=1 Tax=Shewanella sp. 10N.261.52.F9 TaxID=3229684 RepID=UPI003550330C
MPFSDSTLLPSQDGLLHRLWHLSIYGQQLMVLTGSEGAGKTTLVTALLNELEQHSSAFVICPKHCDSAEIRRKVLVQLLNDPVFDDDIPLPESLLSVVDSLPAESCIVLDDAHLLPLEIWAECIVLSQISLAGKSIKILMTSPQEFFAEVSKQLPEHLVEQVVAIDIEPLEQIEREGLYYTLLNRSEQQPFTPRDIVKNRLEMQQGTPKEVVGLLELSLNGEPTEAATKNHFKAIMTLSLLGLLGLLTCLWWFLKADNFPQQTRNKVEFAIQANSSARDFVIDYAERVLANYSFYYRGVESNAASNTNVELDIVVPKVNRREDDAAGNESLSIAEITKQLDMQVKPEANKKVTSFTARQVVSFNDSADGYLDTKLTNPTELLEVTKRFIKPRQGYTLQLASVKRLESLNNMLLLLEGDSQVNVARYRDRWVVLTGHFESREKALKQSALLMEKTGIPQPWLRAWKNLNEYELQEVVPTREIQ